MATSAGLLPFRRSPSVTVLIAHPGGPVWKRRDTGAWSIVKGEAGPGEELLAAALREFVEETGLPAPPGPYLPLGTVTQRAGKVVAAWGVEADVDPAALRPGTITITWHGDTIEIPEIDRVAWVVPGDARHLLNPAQAVLVDRLLDALASADRRGEAPSVPGASHRAAAPGSGSEARGEAVAGRPEHDDPDDGATGDDGTDDTSDGGAQ